MKTYLIGNNVKIYEIKTDQEYNKHMQLYVRLEQSVYNTKLLLEDKTNPVLLEANELLSMIMNSLMHYNYRYATNSKVVKKKK